MNWKQRHLDSSSHPRDRCREAALKSVHHGILTVVLLDQSSDCYSMADN